MIGVNFISCTMGMDVTVISTGRMKMDGIAVYEIKNSKIIRVQFFF